MNNDLQRATDTVRKFVHLYKDLQVVGEALDKISTLEQYTRELEAGIVALQAKKEEAAAKKIEAEDALKMAQELVVDEREGLAAAEEARKRAQRETEELFTELKRKTDQFTEDIRAAQTRERETALKLQSENSKALAKLDDLNKEIRTKQEALAAVSGKGR
jgi:chromosome segregation ATPase